VTACLTAGALIVTATIALAAQISVPSSPLSADAYVSLEKRCGTPKSASPTFAGTVASEAMTPARDEAAGAVRVTGADTITVEFARYLPGDPECCPSSRERASYGIETKGAGPTLVATGTRQVR
jgi:hypothetical protein